MIRSGITVAVLAASMVGGCAYSPPESGAPAAGMVSIDGKLYRQVEEDDFQTIGMFSLKTGQRAIYLKGPLGTYAYRAMTDNTAVVGYFDAARTYINGALREDGTLDRFQSPDQFQELEGVSTSYANGTYIYNMRRRNLNAACNVGANGVVTSVSGNLKSAGTFGRAVAGLTPSSRVRIYGFGALEQSLEGGGATVTQVGVEFANGGREMVFGALTTSSSGPIDTAIVAKCWDQTDLK